MNHLYFLITLFSFIINTQRVVLRDTVLYLFEGKRLHVFVIPLIVCVLQLMVIIGITHALVVFRVMTASWFSRSESDFLEEKASMLAMLLGAVLHYFTIQIMNRVCLLRF